MPVTQGATINKKEPCNPNSIRQIVNKKIIPALLFVDKFYFRYFVTT